jgi:hypothetical protein
MNRVLNFKRNWIIFMLIGSLLTGGCATQIHTVHKSIDPSLANRAYKTRVISQMMNDGLAINKNLNESGPAIQRSDFQEESVYIGSLGIGGALVLGLLAVGIAKGLQSSAETKAKERIAPLVSAAADYNFQSKYWNELEKVLPLSPWLKAETLEKRTITPQEKGISEIIPPLFVLNTSYSLSANAQVLIIYTMASLYLKDPKEADYYGYYTYFSNPAGRSDEVDEKAVSRWSADNASSFREAMAEGIKHNIEMLRLDLLDKSTSPNNEEGEEARLRIRTPFSGILDIWEGKVQSKDENRIIFREQGGNLFSIGNGLLE